MTDNSSYTRDQIAHAYLQTFEKHPAGLVVLDDLHTRFDDFNGFEADPYKNAYNSGKREVIRFIKRQLGIAQTPPMETE
jgi:hypothetical protein